MKLSDVNKIGAGVYLFRHTTRGVVYVGSTGRSIYNRITWHMCALRKGFHKNPAMQEAWADKSGELTFEVIEYCSAAVRKEREIYWARQLLPPSQHTRGRRHTPAQKLRMMEIQWEVSKRPGQLEKRINAAIRGHK